MPIEDTVGAIADLVTEGLVGHIGLSNVTADQLERAASLHTIAAVQTEWSMWTPADPDLLAVAERHGIGIVAWSPLGGGFLTGGLTMIAAGDFRNNVPRLSGSNLAENSRYAPITALAAELELTPSELALAWLLHQSAHVVPIPGSRTPAHITSNVGAAQVVLTPETLQRIDEVRREFQPMGANMLVAQAGAEP